MRIAICDDDVKMASRIEDIVERCRDAMEIDVEVYMSGREIIDTIASGMDFQIYLLDVMMPEVDGFDVAEAVRRRDENALIIFITSNKDMMQRAFDVRAFNYLFKTDDDDRLEQVIRKAISHVYIRQTCFAYRHMSDTCSVMNSRIYYFESRRRKMCIVTAKGEDEFYDTMDGVMKRLNPVIFARIHKSFIVNLEYVERLDGEALILSNGIELKVSKKYRAELNARYRSFVMSRML